MNEVTRQIWDRIKMISLFLFVAQIVCLLLYSNGLQMTLLELFAPAVIFVELCVIGGVILFLWAKYSGGEENE